MNGSKRILGNVISAMILLLALPVFLCAEWIIDTIPMNAEPSSISLALDTHGYPHISAVNWATLIYAHWNGGEWIVEELDTGIEYNAVYSSIALDSLDRPHIAYKGHNYSLKYVYFDGKEWIYQTLDSLYSGSKTRLVLDSLDRPHIVTFRGPPPVFKYYYWDGNEWHDEIIFDGGVSYVGLAIDSNDILHVSFYCPNGNDLWYARRDSTGWKVEIVDNTGYNTDTDIAVDSEGRPHISYYDYAVRDLMYAYYDGKDWKIETVDSYGTTGLFTSIALDSKGRPYICYFDYVEGSTIKIAKKLGSEWEFEVVDTTNYDGVWGGTDIILDSSGYPHIAYYAFGNVRYAYWVPPTEVNEANVVERYRLELYPNPASDNVVIKTPLEGILRIYSIRGGLVREMKSRERMVWDLKDFMGRRVSSGVYFVEFSKGRFKKRIPVLVLEK